MEAKRRIKPQFFIYLVLALFLPVLLGVLLSPISDQGYQFPIRHLTYDWMEDGHPFVSKDLKKGEELVLTWRVPKEPLVAPSLNFNSEYCCFEIYVGDRRIAKYGEPVKAGHRVVPKRVNFIALPEDVFGREVTIHIYSTVDQTFYCNSFYYGAMEDLSVSYLQSRKLPIFGGTFLMIFGLLLTFTVPFIRGTYQKNKSILFHGPLLLDMGIYFLCYNQLTFFIYDNPTFNVYLEHISLYLLPFFMQSTLSFDDIKDSKSATALLAIDFAFPLSTIAFSMSGSNYITEMLPVAHALILIQGILVIIRFGSELTQLKATDQDHYLYNGRIATLTEMVGFIALIVSALAEMVVWYLPSLFGINIDVVMRGGILMYGALFMTAALITSYFYYVVAGKNEASIEEALEGIAYTDEMTGVSNRALCTQQMEALHRHPVPSTIVSIDIDGLKQVNDLLGHQAGDRMIVEFAAVLKEVFEGARLIGRMGGDEFLVILDGEDKEKCEELLYVLAMQMKKKNEVLREFYLKASYGYARLSEVADGDARLCYMLADERMYQMKKEHKGGEK